MQERRTIIDDHQPRATVEAPPPPPRLRQRGIPGSLRRAFVSFEERDFRYLGLSSLALGLGQWGQQIALAWLALELTGSAVQIGIISAFRGGVGVVAAPLGGYLAERFRRRTVILWTTIASAVQASLFAILILSGYVQLWHVYLLAFAGGVIQSVSQPARQAFVFDVSTDETLVNAVAMNSVMQNISRIAGPPLAGMVIGLWGTGSLFAGLAGTQFVAVWFTLMIGLSTRQQRLASEGGALRAFRDMGDGFVYTWNNRLVLGLMLAQSIPILLVVPYLPFLTLFATDVLHQGPEAYGTLSSMAGWGSIAGLMILVGLGNPRRKGLLMVGAFVCYIATVLIFTRSTHFGVSLAALAVCGVFSGIGFTLNNTLIQTAVKNEYRGRVLSVWQLISGLQFAGGLPMGMLIQRYGPSNGVGVFALARPNRDDGLRADVRIRAPRLNARAPTRARRMT
ncbi:MAG: MFS transporter [Dehalococcoidia bacterium]